MPVTRWYYVTYVFAVVHFEQHTNNICKIGVRLAQVEAMALRLAASLAEARRQLPACGPGVLSSLVL